jgi:hypothetical protein
MLPERWAWSYGYGLEKRYCDAMRWDMMWWDRYDLKGREGLLQG